MLSLAVKDVLSSPTNTGITTSGGALTIISGASFAVPSSGTLNISGGSTTGGEINLTQGNANYTLSTANTNGSGGNITLVAFPGTGSHSGTVLTEESTGFGGTLSVLSGGKWKQCERECHSFSWRCGSRHQSITSPLT